MDMAQMHPITNDTDLTPNQGITAGSSAIDSGGKQTRAASAAAYQALLGLASSRLGVPVGSLSVSKGVVTGGGKTVTYGQLLGGKVFNIEMGSQYNLAPTQPPAQSQAQGVASSGSGSSQGLATAETSQVPAFVASTGPGPDRRGSWDEAGRPVHARRGRTGTASDRHPGEGDGHLHLRPQHPDPGNASRPHRQAARAGRLRARARTRRCSRSIPGRSGTSRTRRSSRRATSSA